MNTIHPQMIDLPVNLSTNQLINFITHLADNVLIMSQRLSEWTGHGPALEQDIALTNIALDYLGQSRNYFQYLALLKGDGTTEDSIAYLRDVHAYRNHLLVELPNGDWGQTILKIFFFATYQKELYAQLMNSDDAHLAAIAEKSLKEVNYHVKWSRDWVLRLGDGTTESHQRMQKAIDELWPFTGELFKTPSYYIDCIDLQQLRVNWIETIAAVFGQATLPMPNSMPYQSGGTEGVHTEYLGYILAEMQWLQRVYPGCKW